MATVARQVARPWVEGTPPNLLASAGRPSPNAVPPTPIERTVLPMDAAVLDKGAGVAGPTYADGLDMCSLAMRFLGYVLSSEPTAAMLAPLRDPAFDGLFAQGSGSAASERGLRCVAAWRCGVAGRTDAEMEAAAAGEWLAVLGGAGRPLAAPLAVVLHRSRRAVVRFGHPGGSRLV